MRSSLAFASMLLLTVSQAFSDEPAAKPAEVTRIPKLGIDVRDADAKELQQELGQLQQVIDQLAAKKDERTRSLLPDVQIYAKAVADALKYHEFFVKEELVKAKNLLKVGKDRANQLLAGQAPWTTEHGLIPRGYVSKIDGSVQPYGLEVPATFNPLSSERLRLDIWFHGRGETLSEVNFIDERARKGSEFAPPATIVLHPYGRYCNAFKFAGEVDVFEALENVKKNYRVDEDRISVRGFSMGGAAAWHFAVHFADRWVCASPGAGFAETAEFIAMGRNKPLSPTPYEEKLWHLYDCPEIAGNLFNVPTVAYSGEIDRQKQAADIMAAAMRREGMELRHIIGPQTKHAWQPDAKKTVAEIVDSIADVGRERVPISVQLSTFTLKYNRMGWVTIDALTEHWKLAKVTGQMLDKVELTTANVEALTLNVASGHCPMDANQAVEISIDGEDLTGPTPFSDRSWTCHLKKVGGAWEVVALPTDGVRKQHDLQGPIDDAFMGPFLIVRPTGKCKHPAIDAWVHAEMDHAIEHWRRQFRGEPRVKNDTDVTDRDIADYNLVMWGDAAANSQINKVAEQLPIRWNAEQISADDRYPAEQHVLSMICPNPANTKRYVVLNSGFTYREADYLNNALQVPKLPDWAVIDVRTPPDAYQPGKVVAADFFNEAWQLKRK